MATSTQERDAIRRRLLGWSVASSPVEARDHGRDLVPALNAQGRITDLARVEDVDCLGQSLQLALTTALGSDIFNSSFGFDGLRAFSQPNGPSLARETLRVAVIDVLRAEPRVARIVDVNVEGELTPRDPDTGFGRLAVTVVFETVSGDRVDLTLGGGGGAGG